MRLFVNRLIRFSKNYTNNKYKVGSKDWLSVAYGNGIYIAVGENNTIGKSTDGVNWTTTTISTTDKLKCVIYGNNEFLICAETMDFETRVYHSNNGVDWEADNNTIAMTTNCITYGTGQFGAQFIIAGYTHESYNGRISVSTNGGQTWGTPFAVRDMIDEWECIKTLPGNYYLAASKRTAGQSGIYLSDNGFSWWSVGPTSYQTTRTIFHSIAYGNGKTIVCGNKSTNGVIYSTTDLYNWEILECPIIPYGASFDGEKFVICGYKTTSGTKQACIITTDGKKFSNIIKSDNEEWNDIIFADNKVLVVGDSGYMDVLTF